MESRQWARVRGDVNCSVRRGAWYQVVRLMPDAVVLEVGQRSVSVPRELLQILPLRPNRWSVVQRPYDAVDLPIKWGSRYGVCSVCQHRMPLESQQKTLSCSRCGSTAEVAWRE
ncbi:MAG TPA: hypothetical protein VLT79_09525 [Gemmatimonadales bacterium]|nr:hypothetical protein [Gemmatimonadales bacterium]